MNDQKLMIDLDDLWRRWPWRSQWQSRGYLLMTIDHVTEEVNDNNHPPAKNVPEKIFTKRIRWPNTNGEPGTPSPSWWIGGLSWLKSSSSSSWSSPTSSSLWSPPGWGWCVLPLRPDHNMRRCKASHWAAQTHWCIHRSSSKSSSSHALLSNA